MAPEIIAAIVGGAASVAGAGAQAASASAANRRAYKWSKKFYDYQNQVNQTQYSPAMNMERLRQAGINPHEVSGSPGSGLSAQGNMSVPEYQNPVDPLAKTIPLAVQQAFNMYQQKKALENQSELVKSQVERNTAEAAKTNYQVANILPWTSQFEKNRRNIPLYQMAAYGLKNQLMMQEISMFSMQKQKFQLALDLLQLQKQYQEDYYRYRNESVKWQSKDWLNKAGISALDLKNYQNFGIRPNDPFYARFATNAVDKASEPGFFGRLWNGFKNWWENPFNN